MNSLARNVRRSLVLAGALLAWQQVSCAHACTQPGLLGQTYASEASSHPADDGIGITKRTHSYIFTSTQQMKICSIGYEAPANPPASYTFQLYDCNSGTSIPIAGDSLTVPGSAFSGGLQYVPLAHAWGISPGSCYEVRRKTNGSATAAQRQGRRLANETTYPINAVPALSVLSTEFLNQGLGNPIVDQDLPFIDLGWY